MRAGWCRQGDDGRVSPKPVAVYLEVAPRRVFACSVDWPGWCRSGKNEDEALQALADYAQRYALVAEKARVRFSVAAADRLHTVERVTGNATTAFGAPGVVPALDAEPLTAVAARRMTQLVVAAWAVLDDVAASAPQSLRKGPRGGGRDRDPMLQHVVSAEVAYARTIDVRHKEPVLGDTAAVTALRRDIVAALRAARSGQPARDKGWPPRYAARRIAWHVLDHAWEMTDRSER
ncbi:MAG: hypothetical protein QOI54_2463 [Actinomycetota bacterium]|jgi:hypothetical protein|nr:hypothetical protein [Actinomycetota bacterium]